MTTASGPPARVEPLESRAYLAAGMLDPTFGHLGQVAHAVVSQDDDRATGLAIQPNGKALVLTEARVREGVTEFLLRRFNKDGTLDKSFGQDGVVRRGFNLLRARALALMPDGKIVVAGTRSQEVVTMRFNADGTPDLAFGPEGDGAVVVRSRFGDIDINSIVRLPSGKLMLGGTVTSGTPLPDGTRPDSGAALVRLTADGRSDDPYGNWDFYGAGGRVILGEEDGNVASAVALPDGSVLGVGRSNGDFLLFKLNPAGDLDANFGTDGVVLTDFDGRADDAKGLAVLPDGTIVVCGTSGGDFALARYAADGRSLAPRFGAGGKLRFHLAAVGEGGGGVANAIRVTRDGRLALVGTAGDVAADTAAAVVARLSFLGKIAPASVSAFAYPGGNGRSTGDFAALDTKGNLVVAGARGAAGTADTALARLTAAGVNDPAFAGGRFAAPTVSPAVISAATSARQPDGRIVIAYRVQGNFPGDTAVTRFNADGSVDETFGAGGTAFTNVVGDVRVGEGRLALGVGPGGRIVVASGQLSAEFATLQVVAFRPNGQPDATFGNGGRATFNFPDTGISDPAVIAFQGDRILIGGRFATYQGFNVVRLSAAGQLDSTFGDGGVTGVNFDSDVFGSGVSGVLALGFQPGGKIIAVGYQGPQLFTEFPVQENFAIARLSVDGRLDTTFGDGGKVITPATRPARHTHASAVAILADGRIVVAGFEATTTRPGMPAPPPDPADFVVSRYLTDGALDTAYGTDGRVRITFDTAGDRDDLPGGILLQPDGSAIIGGLSATRAHYGSNVIDAALARVTPAGDLDPTFGAGGKVLTHAGLVDPSNNYIGLSPFTPLPGSDGSTLLAGGAGDTLYLARYLGDAAPAVTAEVVDGVLKITGTAGDDVIRLRRDGPTVEIVGLPQRFPATTFSRIAITALAGHDRVDASAANVPVTIDGGPGDDVLLGGAADDSILGDAGHDTLFGGRGRDTLRGGDGRDYLNAGPGADAAFGDAGNDQVFSIDASPDTIHGGDGFDRGKTDADDVIADIERLFA